MPQIPISTSRIAARTGRTSGPFLDQSINPEAYGAGVGRALQGVGEAAQNVGASAFDLHERKQRERVANSVAQSDFTPVEVRTRQEVGADAAGYHDTILERYDDFIEEKANEIDDDATRMEFRRQMELQRNEVSSRAVLYEERAAQAASVSEANASLSTLENKLLVDPTMYETYVRQGSDVIAARPNLTQAQVGELQQQWRHNAARSRFTGMLEAATSVTDIDNIEAELRGETEGGPDWTQEFAPDDYKRMADGIDTVRRAFITAADAQARAAIDTLEARNSGLTLVPRAELAAAATLVRDSRNPVTQAQFARILRDQELIRTSQGANPAQIRADINSANNGAAYPGTPAPVATAINRAAGTFDVSASYLGATVMREYGGLFKGDKTDYGVKAATSSATGVMQFIDETFLDTMKDGVTPQRIGVSIAGMSDAEILALRSDPTISVMAGAAFAEKNKVYMQRELGRSVDDAELYMAHFLGAKGALTLLRGAATDPRQFASDLLPAAAGANRSIFYDGGRPRTVQEVYNSLARTFVTEPSHVAFGDDETRQRIVDNMETALGNDPMSFAQSQGKFDVGSLSDEASFAARGQSARAVADHYSIPMQDFKPLTIDEAAMLQKQMEDGDADAVLDVLSNVQGMGGDVARAAFAQLGEKDKVYAFAAGLAYEAQAPTAASDVIRGRKRLEENPAIKDEIGNTSEIAQAFTKATGGSLFEIAPRDRQAIQDAAFAHYVETFAARGGTGLDETAFGRSVQAVLGGSENAPAVGNVNGATVVLPKGVDAGMMNQALDNMTVADWTRMSPQKTPPRYVTGEVADPRDLANEAVLRSVGGGQYKIMLDDGTFLVTGIFGQAGRLEAYLFAPDAKTVSELVGRNAGDPREFDTPPVFGVPDLEPPEPPALTPMLGVRG